MKYLPNILIAVIVVILFGVIVELSPLLFDSRLARIFEKGLPTLSVEDGSRVYCRMKASDFRFPLPAGATVAETEITSSSFDSAKGTLRLTFSDPNMFSREKVEQWLETPWQIGGRVSVVDYENEGIRIKFEYFGDK